MLLDVESLLHAAGYRVVRSAESSRLMLENANVLGFVQVYDTPSALIEKWADDQADFLRRHDALLRLDRLKACNVYSILLTSAAATALERHRMQAIEEDVGSTRKIARAGIEGRTDAQRALLPLLPVMSRIVPAGSNPEDQVIQKLDEEERAVFHALRGSSDLPPTIGIIGNHENIED